MLKLREIKFGTYPQSKVTDTRLINNLNNLVGELPTSEEFYKWTSYKYYQNKKITDNMFYIDIEYNQERYRGIYILNYRTFWIDVESSESFSLQDDNGYFINTIYWFKYEQITWEVINEKNGELTLLSKKALDSQSYDFNGQEICTLYNFCLIRKWLTTTFFKTAFNKEEHQKMVIIEVDNSPTSANYKSSNNACDNTFDKVCLMSVAEMYDYSANAKDRLKTATDYAISQGCLCSEEEKVCTWWLRSPHNYDNKRVHSVSFSGGLTNFVTASDCSGGVVPVIKINNK